MALSKQLIDIIQTERARLTKEIAVLQNDLKELDAVLGRGTVPGHSPKKKRTYSPKPTKQRKIKLLKDVATMTEAQKAALNYQEVSIADGVRLAYNDIPLGSDETTETLGKRLRKLGIPGRKNRMEMVVAAFLCTDEGKDLFMRRSHKKGPRNVYRKRWATLGRVTSAKEQASTSGEGE